MPGNMPHIQYTPNFFVNKTLKWYCQSHIFELIARKIYYLYLGPFLDHDDEILGFLKIYHCLIPNKFMTCRN